MRLQDEAEDTDMAEAVSDMLNGLISAALTVLADEKALEHAYFTQLMQLIRVRRLTNVYEKHC